MAYLLTFSSSSFLILIFIIPFNDGTSLTDLILYAFNRFSPSCIIDLNNFSSVSWKKYCKKLVVLNTLLSIIACNVFSKNLILFWAKLVSIVCLNFFDGKSGKNYPGKNPDRIFLNQSICSHFLFTDQPNGSVLIL